MCYSLYLCSGLNVDGLKHLENMNQNTLLIPEENKFSCPLVGLQWRFDLQISMPVHEKALWIALQSLKFW